MNLSEAEQKDFFANYLPLLFYAAVYESLIPPKSIMKDFFESSNEIRIKSRQSIFEDKQLLQFFLSDNKHLLDKAAVEFVKNVSKGVFSNFVALEQKTQHAVFLDMETDRFYNVIGLTDPIDKLLPNMPVQATTAIFNFKGKIICDGLFINEGPPEGNNIVKELMAGYREAIKDKKVCTLL